MIRPLLSLLCLALSGCLTSIAGETQKTPVDDTPLRFVFEVRAPKSVSFDPLTRVILATDQLITENTLRGAKQREEGDFVVFQESFWVHNTDARRAVIVAPASSDPDQVFTLALPQVPAPADWSKWVRPSYIDTDDAVMPFVDGRKTQTSSALIPKNSFEMRFKLEKPKPRIKTTSPTPAPEAK